MMDEQDLKARAARCSAGILLAVIVLIAHLPLIFLIIPVVIFLSGIVAGTEEIHAAWYGILSTSGIFDPAALDDEEKAALPGNRHYFWFGEVVSAAALAGVFTIPMGMILAVKSGTLPAFTIAAMLFLLLFVFLPKLIRKGMNTDTDTIILLFGRNEQVKKVFWSVFIVLAGFVLAQVVDPQSAQAILRLLSGSG
jgi:hypothetical protein